MAPKDPRNFHHHRGKDETLSARWDGPMEKAESWICQNLEEEGYLRLLSNPAPNLDNAIHPVLGRSKWLNITDSLYSAMEPALRLASLFLTDPRVLDWHFHDALGEAVEKEGLWYKAKNPLEEDGEYAFEVYNADLDELTEHITWRFPLSDFETGDLGRTYHFQAVADALFASNTIGRGRSETLQRAAEDRLWDRELARAMNRKPEGPWCTPAVVLAKEFRDRLETERSPQSWRTKENKKAWTEYLNLQFHLAAVIGHEIAHAMNMIRKGCVEAIQEYDTITTASRRKSDERRKGHELYLDFLNREFDETYHTFEEARTDPYQVDYAENGHSWERYMFGSRIMGLITAHIYIKDRTERVARSALVFRYVSRVRLEGENGQDQDVKRALCEDIFAEMSWVRNWFQKEHWADGKTSEDIRKRASGRFRTLTARTEGWEAVHGDSSRCQDKPSPAFYQLGINLSANTGFRFLTDEEVTAWWNGMSNLPSLSLHKE